MYIAIFFYVLAIILQLFAASYAATIFFKSAAFRKSSGVLALGLLLMTERRIEPLIEMYQSQQYSIDEAIFSLVISSLLLLAMSQIKKLIALLEEQNFILDRTSKTDSLTQATSRPETFNRAELEIERALRSNIPVAFLMLDIDHFKKVNDQYGHPAGDLVLQSLTKYCQGELRVVDIFGRVGGEEFLIVLPESSEALAFDVAERLRKKIASSVAVVVDGHEVFITVSIGIAIFDPVLNGEIRPKVILNSGYKRADEALYLAKSNGRNRTESWSC
ncbi:GGDEF domain-containing protein [Polynucleobacter asymbioticus]|uniref:diguanylate cyclase n=2 Tax=Polynucleobacter asymbioticus TaxID=576611 RepID=A4SY26_POLAQ|nr:GGDEF domain-containing protein [Polynucleobacter asymbioticus]ABP34390.1 diguanylate cyclase [Polynucleobacter asymbioticus QLW-P1DMWA-1]APC06233.1 hypothetical protein AOC10_06685 [Polynucleobacter asymbioticus]